VEKVKDRVSQEYKLKSEQIQVQIPTDAMISNSRLIDELLWNIFDNAFKHGSPSLSVQGTILETNGVDLEIRDRGSGLPAKIKNFLNLPDAISKESRPMVGLGVVLIRGIAALCGISLHVSDNVEDMSVQGTTFHLKFNGA
jgi:K+-sensing histidine kinase KdpD